MAVIKDEKNPLNDILFKDKEGNIVSSSDSAIFKRYRERQDVMMDILKEFVKEGEYTTYKPEKGRGGYYISENAENEIGTISHALAISTFVSFLPAVKNNDDDLDILKKVYEHHNEIVFYFNEILNDLHYQPGLVNYNSKGKKLKVKDYKSLEHTGLVYSAKPYISDDKERGTHITTFTDTMAKILTMACDMRYYLLRCRKHKLEIEGFDDLLKKAEDLICLTMRDLTVAAIPVDRPSRFIPFAQGERYEGIDDENSASNVTDGDDQIIRFKGWNFLSSYLPNDHKLQEPRYGFSFYVTHSVCQAYTSVYNYFQYNIAECRHYREHEKKVKNSLSTSKFEPYKEVEISEQHNKERFEENKAFFESIFDLYFFPFSKVVLDAGRYINMRMYENNELDVSKDFIGNNFAPVSLENIKTSSTNDAIFNTLFAFGIFISSGLDIDYNNFDYKKYNLPDNKDRFFNDINYGLVNVDRSLKELMKENKEYIVKQYILSVWETIPDDEPYVVVNAKKIRKRRIQTMTVIPLLINVHCAVAKYITQYPEREMTTYLTYIMEKRYRDDNNGKQIWAWDDDGYDLNNTLLYIDALNSFYDYYEVYEKDFIVMERKNASIRQQEREAANEKLKAKDAIIAEKDKKIEELQKKDPFIESLEKLIENYLKENLPNLLASVLENEVKNHSLKDEKGNYSPLYEALLKLILSYALEPARIYSDVPVTNQDVKTGQYQLNERTANMIIQGLKEEILDLLGNKGHEAYLKEETKSGNGGF